MRKLWKNTNKNIERFLEMSRYLIESSNKYTSYKTVDVIDISKILKLISVKF